MHNTLLSYVMHDIVVSADGMFSCGAKVVTIMNQINKTPYSNTDIILWLCNQISKSYIVLNTWSAYILYLESLHERQELGQEPW